MSDTPGWVRRWVVDHYDAIAEGTETKPYRGIEEMIHAAHLRGQEELKDEVVDAIAARVSYAKRLRFAGATPEGIRSGGALHAQLTRLAEALGVRDRVSRRVKQFETLGEGGSG